MGDRFTVLGRRNNGAALKNKYPVVSNETNAAGFAERKTAEPLEVRPLKAYSREQLGLLVSGKLGSEFIPVYLIAKYF